MAAPKYSATARCTCGNPLKVFASSGRTQIACRACRLRRTPTPDTCGHCGKALIKTAAHQKFCGFECCQAHHGEKARAQIPRAQCSGCGETFQPKTGRGKWCSKRCRENWRSSWRRAKTVYDNPERVSRVKVFKRDGWRCQICGKATPRERMGTRYPNAPEADHRQPLSKGGQHTFANLQTTCKACNRMKSNVYTVGQLPMFG